MSELKSICVYCGTGEGTDPAYVAAATTLGRNIAEAGLSLVYGGGSIGLMGAVARATLEAGGKVTGIIPRFLQEREVMMQSVTELIVTEDMHERKRAMFERADGFVALPGGIGTLEELVEVLTWGQLGRHRKPVVLADINGFWRPLVDLLEHMKSEAFIRPGFEIDYHAVGRAADIVPTLREACKRATQGAQLADLNRF
ncbi:TIGR00730 family Rossman fold protein [Stappia taiwanensis]|uniref:Cytokinin riboside 5'-monophosphate phosphoribohydrolase n=1 Tax=Stappia taiwanensis TaxID=992267 RepID=A0A838XME9_9HYPH|nr:TIGR00730 family Rossman fold protein [Stappia taiwanensis]MBA4611685.1 TIGR00730 family Rossman fold protein [Stappia taiwanensis]GGE97585.1 cytokinin riboside 5'-monophosphate phosphoribohydrolase [Stappia taiwanensis]